MNHDISSGQSILESGGKVFGISSIARHILKLDIDLLSRIPFVLELLTDLGGLTVACLKFKVNDPDDTWFMDACEVLLSIWSVFVESLQHYSEAEIQRMMQAESTANILQLLSNVAAEIVTVYIDAQVLATPMDEDDDFAEKDIDVFGDQLINIGMLARLKLDSVLEKMLAVLNEKHQQLLGFLQAYSVANQSATMILQEQIHWAVLIAGHILADGGYGETPEIHSSIMKLSSATPTNRDLAVLLPSKIFNMLDSLSFPIDAPQVNLFNKHSLCSPLLIETLFWFVDRWSSTYLFPNPANYPVFSPSIEQSFGVNGGGSQILGFILSKILIHVQLWNNEVDIVTQIITVLQGLSKNGVARDAMMANGKIF